MSNHLQPYQLRVIEEAAELSDKLQRLRVFIDGPMFPKLAFEERNDMLRQRDLQAQLVAVLESRIARARREAIKRDSMPMDAYASETRQ